MPYLCLELPDLGAAPRVDNIEEARASAGGREEGQLAFPPPQSDAAVEEDDLERPPLERCGADG